MGLCSLYLVGCEYEMVWILKKFVPHNLNTEFKRQQMKGLKQAADNAGGVLELIL